MESCIDAASPPPSCADSNDHLLQRQSHSSRLLVNCFLFFRFVVMLVLFTSLAFGENFNRSSQNQRHPQTRRCSQRGYQSPQPAQPWIFTNTTLTISTMDNCHLNHLYRGHFITSSFSTMDTCHLILLHQGHLSPHLSSTWTYFTSSSFTMNICHLNDFDREHQSL